MKESIAWLGVVLLGLGCGTSYRPRPTSRIGLVINHGGASYLKDDQQFPIGPLGGDLAWLVADTPAAVVHARAARADLAVGVPCYVAGLGSVVVGILALSGPVGWVVIGAGGAIGGTGLGLMGAGVTHAVDAVNIHNDATAGR